MFYAMCEVRMERYVEFIRYINYSAMFKYKDISCVSDDTLKMHPRVWVMIYS